MKVPNTVPTPPNSEVPPIKTAAIAAVLIGGTSLFGGVGTVFGTFIGALILTLVLNGMNLLSVNANWQPFITGVIVILAVWLDMATRRHKL
jgi:ribose transport system permease protein